MPTLFSSVPLSICYSASKTHLPESLPVTLSQRTHTHLVFLNNLHWLLIEQCIKFKLASPTHNTLCSTQPVYLHSLLNYHTSTRSLRSANTNLLSVPHVRTAFASRGFSVAAPTVWNSLPSDIRVSIILPIPSVAFLKLTASSRSSAPHSGSPKCLRFGH